MPEVPVGQRTCYRFASIFSWRTDSSSTYIDPDKSFEVGAPKAGHGWSDPCEPISLGDCAVPDGRLRKPTGSGTILGRDTRGTLFGPRINCERILVCLADEASVSSTPIRGA